MALAVDSSTPALVSSADPWTTASFTPPVDSLLVAVVMGDWFGGTPTISVTSTGLTFTQQVRRGAANQGLVEVWTAPVGASGGSARTVTADTSLAANTGGLKVYVVTSSTESEFYVDATAGATGVTTNSFNGSITTNSDGAWVFGGGSEWNNLGSPTSSDTGEAGTPTGVAVLAVRKGSASATAGSETLNFDASGTSAAMWSWAAVAIQEGPSPWPYLVEAGTLSAAASGTSITPAIPASAQADDVMLMAAMCNGSTTFTTPTGWTLLGTSIESNANQSTEWYWKRHDGSETDPTSTTSATLSSTVGGYGRIYVFRNCLTSGDPFEDVTMAGTPTNGANPTSAAIDTTDVNRLAVCLLAVDDDNTWSSGNPPTDWTAIGRVVSTTGGDCMMDGLTRPIPAAGAVAQVTIGSQSASDYWRSLTLALIPEPTGGGPVDVTVDTATLTLAGVDPAASGSGSVSIVADVAALTLSGVDPAAATGGSEATADPASLTLSGVDATLAGTGSTTLTVDTATLTLSGITPTAAGTGTAATTADPAALTLTGITPGAAGTGSAAQTLDVAVLSLAGVDLEVSAGGLSVTVDPASLTLGGQAPTLTATGSGGVTVDVATLTLAGITPQLAGNGSAAVIADSATLTLLGATPVTNGTGSASILADAAVLTLEGVETFIAGTEPSVLAGSTDTTSAPFASARTTTAVVSSSATVGGPATSTPTVSES